jgi:hypothetical protein
MGSEWDWKEFNNMMKTNNIFPFNTKEYASLIGEVKVIPIKVKTSYNYKLYSSENGIIKIQSIVDCVHTDCFEVVKIDESLIAIMDYKHKYISSDIDLKGLCIANRQNPGSWEKFEVQYFSDKTVTLKNSNGFYLTNDSLNQIIGNTLSFDSALHFSVISK